MRCVLQQHFVTLTVSVRWVHPLEQHGSSNTPACRPISSLARPSLRSAPATPRGCWALHTGLLSQTVSSVKFDNTFDVRYARPSAGPSVPYCLVLRRQRLALAAVASTLGVHARQLLPVQDFHRSHMPWGLPQHQATVSKQLPDLCTPPQTLPDLSLAPLHWGRPPLPAVEWCMLYTRCESPYTMEIPKQHSSGWDQRRAKAVNPHT